MSNFFMQLIVLLILMGCDATQLNNPYTDNQRNN